MAVVVIRTTLFWTLPLAFADCGATGTGMTAGACSVGLADAFGAIGGGGAVCWARTVAVAISNTQNRSRPLVMRKPERSDEATRNQIPSARLTSKFRVCSNRITD